MVTTFQPQTAPQTTTPTAAVTTGAPAASNEQSAQQALVERLRRAAGGLSPEWRLALGALVPPDAGGPSGRPPDLATFRRAAFALELRAVGGNTDVALILTEQDELRTYRDALRQVADRAPGDRAQVTALRTLIAWLGGGGDLAVGAVRIAASVGLLSEDGKRWLAADRELAPALEAHAAAASGDPARAAALRGLAGALRNPPQVGPLAQAAVTPVPLTPEQRTAADALIRRFEQAMPAQPAAATLAERRAQRARTTSLSAGQQAELLAAVRAAEPRVRDHVFAWRNAEGDGVLDLLRQHASVGQADALTSELDPVARLGHELTHTLQQGGGRRPFAILLEFAQAHAGEPALRERVLASAPIMQNFVAHLGADESRRVIRLLTTGQDGADAVEKIYDAAGRGDGSGVLAGLLELGHTPGRLAQLRTDHLFVHRLSLVNTPVTWNGVSLRPYDVFLQMCGVNPFETREPGAVARQAAVDPTGTGLPLNRDERTRLDNDLYKPAVDGLCAIFDRWRGINDNDTLAVLRGFQRRAAEPEVAALLRRAHEAPGPTLSSRISARGHDVRGRMRGGIDDDHLPEVERILGFATDQAAVGVIGGRGTLATDGQVADGQAKVPLEQALRETLVGGQVLSRFIHDQARVLADELNEGALSGWADEDDVRSIWSGYRAVVTDAVCADLRGKTGLARVWPIELLANAFLQVAGAPLQHKLNSALSDSEKAVISEMGMTPTQVGTRAQMAAQDLAQTAIGEQQAAAAVTAAQQAERFAAPARALFAALVELTRLPHAGAPDDSVLRRVRQLLRDGLAIADASAPAAAAPPTSVAAPSAARASAAAPAATSFRGYYRREYGLDPTRHVVEVAQAVARAGRGVDASALAENLGVDAADLSAARAPAATEALVIDEQNRTLVGPDFTVAEAERRAGVMWDELHRTGQVQLIRAELDGRTAEEQRLIHVAFRRRSGGIDLRYYLQQARAQMGSTGGIYSRSEVAAGQGAVSATGSQAELDLLLDVTAHGRVPLPQRLRGAAATGNLNEVYQLIEAASADDRRAVLADGDTMAALRRVADDAHEWSRVHRSLTGELDLYDRLESRAHGAGGFWGFLDNTDEKGMERDIRAFVAQRRRAIRAEETRRIAGAGSPTSEQATQITQATDARLRDELMRTAHNPSIRAILTSELSGTELSTQHGLILGAGEDSLVAASLTDGDWTEDEERIIADIRRMPLAERQRRRTDPEYLRRLQAAIGSQTTWRDAMNALYANHEPGADDNLSELERAARTFRQDSSEFYVDGEDVIERLTRLSQAEYTRLMGDAALQQQILQSLAGDPTRLQRARELMSFRAADARAELTGTDPSMAVTVGGAGAAPGPVVEDERRLAYAKWSAVQRLRYGASRSWGKLLEAALETYKLGLAPSAGPADATAATPVAAAAGAAPAAAPSMARTGAISGPVGEAERRLRAQIWDEVAVAVAGATVGWGAMEDVSPTSQTEIIRAAIAREHDPSNLLLDLSTHWSGDSEDRIKSTLRNASDDMLISQWTTVRQVGPDGSPSLEAAYRRWAASRAPAPATGARRPRVGSPEWEARVAFQTYAIDTSRPLENLLLSSAGGLMTDNAATRDGERAVRDNSEWRQWRGLVRERIPGLDKDKIARAIGASADREAIDLIKNPSRDALTQLRYDDEQYAVDRGSGSNYNMDRLTAGAEGVAVDNTMADYRRTVLTGLIADPTQADAASEYGQLSDGETEQIGDTRAAYNTSREQFTAAKQRVADIAAAVVAIIITAVVTILTAGTATGPVAVALLGALTAGTASLGAQATREVVQGTSFDFSNEGLQQIARDTITGMVTAGSVYYAQRVTAAVYGATSAATQGAALAGVARTQPSLLAGLVREGSEEAIEEGFGGLFEVASAPFDPAMWREGWNEGWLRGSRLVRDKAAEIPGRMMMAAASSVLTSSVSHAAGGLYGAARARLGAGAAAAPGLAEAAEAARPGHAAFGTRGTTGQRTTQVLTAMIDSLGSGAVQGSMGSSGLLDERVFRAEGQDAATVIGGIGMAALVQMREAATSLHVNDAFAVQRAIAGARQLDSATGRALTRQERTLYAQMVMTSSETSSVLSVEAFAQIRQQALDAAVARHEAQTGQPLSAAERRAFVQYAREAATIEQFHQRAAEAPYQIPAVQAARTVTERAAARTQERAAAAHVAAEQADPTGPARQAVAALRSHAAEVAASRAETDTMRDRSFAVSEQIRTALGQVPTGSPLHNRRMELYQQLMAVTARINEQLGTAMMNQHALELLPMDLELQLARLDLAGPPEQADAGRQALYQLVIDARVKAATAPTALAAAVASARAALAEKDGLLIQAEAVRDVALRDSAARTATADLPPAPPATPPAPGVGAPTPTGQVAPVSQAPVSQAPVSQAPVSQAPVSQAPVAPVSQGPVAATPASPAETSKYQELLAAHGPIEGPRLFQEWQARQVATASVVAPAPLVSTAPTTTTGVYDILSTQFADRLTQHDPTLTPAPTGKPVLPHRADDALIGLPVETIDGTASADKATGALQETGLPRWAGLSPSERMHEEAFAAQAEADLPGMRDAFLAMSFDKKLGTHVFEVDGAKKLYEQYGAGKKAENDAQLRVRVTANHALHPTAVAVARLAFLKRLDELGALPKESPQRAVFVTNGGCAAGKGSLSGLVRESTGSFDFGAVWDAAGEGDAQENGWILAAAQARGLKVVYGYAENDPMKTYQSVLQRAEGSGRIVDPVTFARSYTRGQANMKAFLESDAYKQAVASGQASALGLYTGQFDPASLAPGSNKPDYPDMRLLGDRGAITSQDLVAPPDETVVVDNAAKQFEAWLKAREAEGKDNSIWFEGAITNPLKFGAITQGQEQASPTAAIESRLAASEGKLTTLEAYTTAPPPKGPGIWDWMADPRNWQPARVALHERLLAAALADAKALAEALDGEPTLHAMRGNTAAGKTRAIKGNLPQLETAVEATADRRHRAVNPDAFKIDLIAASEAGLSSTQVHMESSMLADRLEQRLRDLRRSDGKLASMLIDKRLGPLEDIEHYAAMARETGRKLALHDVDAPLETSMSGVLARSVGGDDPIPPFDVVRKGFIEARRNRTEVIKVFLQDPTLGSYELFGTLPDNTKVKVVEVIGGELLIHDAAMYKQLTADPSEQADRLGEMPITREMITRITGPMTGGFKAKLQGILEEAAAKGLTWKAALDAHSAKRKPRGGA